MGAGSRPAYKTLVCEVNGVLNDCGCGAGNEQYI
jgi:hypothetical protein